MLSGGNSTTRKIVPLGGGSSTTLRSAASFVPELSAGAPSVTHRFVRPNVGTPGIVNTCGDGPSLAMIDFPLASWPVTIRRIGLSTIILLRSSQRRARSRTRPAGSDSDNTFAGVPVWR